jgi:hypothetical protein
LNRTPFSQKKGILQAFLGGGLKLALLLLVVGKKIANCCGYSSRHGERYYAPRCSKNHKLHQQAFSL